MKGKSEKAKGKAGKRPSAMVARVKVLAYCAAHPRCSFEPEAVLKSHHLEVNRAAMAPIYAALRKMEKAGLLRRVWEKSVTGTNTRGRGCFFVPTKQMKTEILHSKVLGEF